MCGAAGPGCPGGGVSLEYVGVEEVLCGCVVVCSCPGEGDGAVVDDGIRGGEDSGFRWRGVNDKGVFSRCRINVSGKIF